ncbi:stage III sporulation protein AF [Paenibacillus sp. GCM10027627]|uniref:stage III sporulation protein AF n=1 Tax=unclassified Paenibacillus TaxID=185978 RepID=UPI00363C4BDE
MIAWLSDWLRDIIAVILLAMLAELLLPNKAMLRYARLVVGLFILLTILSPILKLLQTDMADRLDAGIALWSEQSAQQKTGSPSLEQIQKRAEEIRAKRDEEAAKLTEKTLEQNMLKDIASNVKSGVESVDVELTWKKGGEAGGTPNIVGVIVTLKALGAGQKEAPEQGAAESVEPIAPVSISVEVKEDAGAPAKETGSSPEEQKQAGFVPPSQAEASAIGSVLAKNWGVHGSLIAIKQRSPAGVAQ